MEENAFLIPLSMAILGLVVGAILNVLLRKTRIPYTVGLFAVGLIVGGLNRMELFGVDSPLSEGVNSVVNINPDLILYLFLPILIFDAAYELNMHIFKRTMGGAVLLAAPGLVIAMLLTGLLMMGIGAVVPDFSLWGWPFAMMFGALISATDPVAVVALLHELKTSKRFSTLVDAESILNDGTGIVCFMFFFGPFMSASNGMGGPVREFFYVMAMSSLLGFVIARLILWFITQVNSEEHVQNSVIILSAYLTFILAQHTLGVSGIIALLAFGLTISYIGKPQLKPEVNDFMGRFWDLLTYAANTLIFIIVGVIIAGKIHFSWTALGVLLLVYVALNLIRYVMIAMLYPMMKRIGYGLNRQESLVLTWGGLRGALGMTLALMVSYTPSIPEVIRDQILFLTAGIVTLTLCVNATTVRWLLNRLGMINTSTARNMMRFNTLSLMYADGVADLNRLKEREDLKETDWERTAEYLPEKPERPRELPEKMELLAELRLHILDKEKLELKALYEEGLVSQAVFRRLMNSLDELYDADGKLPLDERPSIFAYCDRMFFLGDKFLLPKMHDLVSFAYRRKITSVYELGHGFYLLQQRNQRFLDKTLSVNNMSRISKDQLKVIQREIEHNLSSMNALMERVPTQYPRAYRHALTHIAIRMLLCDELRRVEKLEQQGVISEEEARSLRQSIDRRRSRLGGFTHSTFYLTLRKMFPLFLKEMGQRQGK